MFFSLPFTFFVFKFCIRFTHFMCERSPFMCVYMIDAFEDQKVAPRTGVTVGCGTTYGCWELKPGPLQEQ